MLTHFTHTGHHAGLVYCGQARNETDKYMHMNLAYISKRRADMCPKCLAIFENCSICEQGDCKNCVINELT